MKEGRFARRVFIGAGVYGLIGVLPLFFLEPRFVEMFPPELTHPEFFYGFAGVALAWQVAFLVIGSDPARFRPLMPVTVLEKLAFAVPVILLYRDGRVASAILPFAAIDLVLGLLFFLSYRRTASSPAA